MHQSLPLYVPTAPANDTRHVMNVAARFPLSCFPRIGWYCGQMHQVRRFLVPDPNSIKLMVPAILNGG